MNQTSVPDMDSVSSALSGMLDYRLHRLPEEEAEQLAESLAEIIDTPQIHGPDLDLCEPITRIEIEPRGKPWKGAIITFHMRSSPDGIFVELPEMSASQLYHELANFYRGSIDGTR